MASGDVSRRLSAILAADMVGYSRLVQLDEGGTITRQKAILDAVILPAIAEAGGRLVKTTGDGVLAEFPSAVNSVLCAVAIQRGVAEREADAPKDRRIVYRIGVNLGEIIHDGGDIFGDGVNVAARLESLAAPGGICISRSVFNNVKGRFDLGFADLGPQRVKNIAEPVVTYRVLLDPDDAGKTIRAPRRVSVGWLAVALLAFLALAGGYLFWSRPAPATGPPLLLVLPYRGDDGAGQWAEAVSENLWLTLARIKGMTMVPRAAAADLRGVDSNPEQIAALGQVTHVLHGTVTEVGDAVTITTRLRRVDAAGMKTLWSKETGSPTADTFANLTNQKLAMLSVLNLPLGAAERQVMEQTLTTDPAAFLLYAEAQKQSSIGHWNGVGTALGLFEKAAALDLDFTEALIGAAWANYTVWSRSWNIVRFTPDALGAAQDIAERLLARDPLNPDALAIQVLIRMNQLKQDEAVTMARGALFRNADAPILHYALSQALSAIGDYPEALSELDAHARLSARLTLPEMTMLARGYLRLGHAAPALDLLSGHDETQAGMPGLLADAHARLGNMKAARAHFQIALKAWPANNINWNRPFFEIYHDPEIFAGWAEMVRGLGMPLWPYGFDQAYAADRLDAAALTALFGPGYRTVDTIDPLGQTYHAISNPDGTGTVTYAWMPGLIFRGTWEIDGDAVCFRYPAVFMGRRFCDWFYIDRENGSDAVPRYIQLNNFGLHRFAVAPLEN